MSMRGLKSLFVFLSALAVVSVMQTACTTGSGATRGGDSSMQNEEGAPTGEEVMGGIESRSPKGGISGKDVGGGGGRPGGTAGGGKR